MTAHQYGTLKYICNYRVDIYKQLKRLNMGTVGSMIKRGWLTHNSGELTLTENGFEEYQKYSHPVANFRKVEKDISEHVRSMLHINKLLTMKLKKAS